MHIACCKCRHVGNGISARWGTPERKGVGGNILVSYQRQVLELCYLVLLPGHAQQRHLDLAVLGHRGVGDGLGQGHVRLGVGRLDQRPHERLGRLGGFGARCPGRDVDRVDDSFETICGAEHNQVSNCARSHALGRPVAPVYVVFCSLTLLDNCHSVLKRLFRVRPRADRADAHDAGNLVFDGDLAADNACH